MSGTDAETNELTVYSEFTLKAIASLWNVYIIYSEFSVNTLNCILVYSKFSVDGAYYVASSVYSESTVNLKHELWRGNPDTPGTPPLRVDSRVLQQWLRCAIATNLISITKLLRFRIASLSNRFAFEWLRFRMAFLSLRSKRIKLRTPHADRSAGLFIYVFIYLFVI